MSVFSDPRLSSFIFPHSHSDPFCTIIRSGNRTSMRFKSRFNKSSLSSISINRSNAWLILLSGNSIISPSSISFKIKLQRRLPTRTAERAFPECVGIFPVFELNPACIPTHHFQPPIKPIQQAFYGLE